MTKSRTPWGLKVYVPTRGGKYVRKVTRKDQLQKPGTRYVDKGRADAGLRKFDAPEEK